MISYGNPQVTMGFNSMGKFAWGYPHDLGTHRFFGWAYASLPYENHYCDQILYVLIFIVIVIIVLLSL